MQTLNLAKLEDQRQHLINFIEKNTPQGSMKNHVTIVFDGSEDVFGSMTSSNAKVLFSRGESADDKIKKVVSNAQNSKSIVVVTDDRDIQYAVRALGAKVNSVEEFLNKGKGIRSRKNNTRKKLSNKKLSSLGGKKQISKSDESKINTELEKIWLKSDEA